MFQDRIRLFWWNEKIIQGKTKENYGDALGRYLVQKISGRKIVFAWPKKFSFLDWSQPIYVTIGSIIHHVNDKCIVWGSGIINQEIKIKKAKFAAVRGPQTRAYLMKSGYQVPEVYGDPALLMPQFFKPRVDKKFKYGIVPHYNDYSIVADWFKDQPDVHLIDLMTNDIEAKTIEFLQCKSIISSSLHGIIIAHAYGIPAVWQKFSDKVFGDDIKYQDYMESVGLQFYRPEVKLTRFTEEQMENLFKKYPNLPKQERLMELCEGLMRACPFKL
ncbi:polysaccharide pyruvyl transferase family protein [Flavobacterium antarcticum]|uniref:polysaccharide pyruvyl transferase family protein n=1 Tax=Flavobacterium antarcticum TaxID=271155 RepID=UPI0003B4E021|nr:polysaccharide pyruvyl transferase family protein [Flavobacterium antarcticum]